MHTKNFFKPTIIYKEYMILNLIEKDPNITQREISTAINIAVSMVNTYIDMYEKQGLLEKEHISTKIVRYHITKQGIERRKFLNIGYLNSAQEIYDSAKENIEEFLYNLSRKGYKDILLYGAGEVAEILLQTITSTKSPVNVVAVVDDNITKQHSHLVGRPIVSYSEAIKLNHDAILISSYANNEIIYMNLVSTGYDKNKIIKYFDI